MAGSQARGEEDGLHSAARVGDVPTIRRLLNAQPQSVQDKDRHARTPLHLAAWAGQIEAVRVLCEANADVGATAGDDMAAIHFACQKGHAEVAKILLAAGAQLNMRTRKGLTPLHYAVQGRHQDVAKLLILRGASLSAQNKAGKRPADLCQDQSFLATIKEAAEERQALETKRKAQKAAQSAANKARFANLTAAEDENHEDKDEEAAVPTIGPTLPPQFAEAAALASLPDEQEEDANGTSVRPAKRAKLDGTVLLGHLLEDE